uniref:hypothetical protein n=1 Tax=Alloprevotella tannerae TaxID=76122 RepID=UPI0028E2BF80
WQIAATTGWSEKYIMWGIPWQKLLLMLADAPHYVNKTTKKQEEKKKDTVAIFKSFERRILNKNKV